MSRKPMHTPESRAQNATEKIRKAVPGLSFSQLSDIEKALASFFTEAGPVRNRKDTKQKTPATV